MKKVCLFLILLLALSGAITEVHGAVTFQHTMGFAYNAQELCSSAVGAANYVETNGLQPVCEKTVIIYSTGSVQLVPTTASSRIAYRRWYDYDESTETESSFSTSLLSFPSLSNTDSKYVTTYSTDKGVVKLESSSTPRTTTYPTYNYTGSGIEKIYCDQSNYKDYVKPTSTSNGTFREGTLSQRMIFEIRPAKTMADSVENYKSTNVPSSTDRFMEEYNRIAPKGKTIYLGPQYQFATFGSDKQMVTNANWPIYKIYDNYYYLNNNTPTKLSGATWYWTETAGGNSTETEVNSGNTINDQFIKMTYDGTADTVVYTLTAHVRIKKVDYYYRIAKFTVVMIDPEVYGPIAHPTIESVVDSFDILTSRDFNTFKDDKCFQLPSGTAPTYSSVPFKWEETNYGFAYEPLSGADYRLLGVPTYGDYTFLNNSNAFAKTWAVQNLYNHNSQHSIDTDGIDPATGTLEDAKNGYFLFIDGAQKPGECFSMKVNTDLCVGMTLYLSAYVASIGWVGNPPLINLTIEGVDDKGATHEITTFVSGEIWTDAGYVDPNGTRPDKTVQGKWLRILCPIKLTEKDIYPEYRFTITNKGDGKRGNDFAIDDVAIYASAPSVSPIQASSAVCVDAESDDFTIYMRMEYEKSRDEGNLEHVYYQWQQNDENHTPLDLTYYGETAETPLYGEITLPTGTPEEFVYDNIQAFDTMLFAHPDRLPQIAYIQEYDKDTREDKWVLYVATRAKLTPGETYLIGTMTGSAESLGNSVCGVYSQLDIKGSMYMTINEERILSGMEIDACGNRLVHFGLERMILYSTPTGMKEKRATCRANWLWGTKDFINSNQDIYGASYETIEDAILEGTDPTLLDNLESKGLYFTNKKILDVYLSADEEKRWLGYTAFPIEGTGVIVDDNGKETTEEAEMCLKPITGEVNLSEKNDNALRIGTKSETVPDIVLANLRTIRVSKAQCDQGFAVPVYSESRSSFTIQAAQLFSTTEQNVETLSLPLSNSTVSPTTQSITLQGGATGTGQLQAGNEYVFALHESNFSEKNCNTGAAYFRVIVVPDCVKWSSTANGVWNNDANWQTADGKQAWCPLAGTDVILSESNYKLLLQDDEMKHGANPYLQYDINYEPNTCNNIYVPAGAALLNQHLLNITGKPVVEMSVPTNQWTLCAMPVAGCVSGDLWSPAAGESQTDPFTVASISQTVGASADDRLVNRVWQSLFNKQISNKTTKEDVDVSSSTWTAPLNALTTSYPAGTGVALWVENSNGGNQVTFRLPKNDAAYHYWQANKWHARSETVSRTANGLAYQQDMTIALQNHDNTGDMFLFGNPTLAYIDMAKLTESNPELAGSWYVLTDNTADLSQELTASVKDVSTDGGDYSLLAPGRAVLLKSKETGGTLHIRITPEMLTLPESKAALSAPKRAKERARNYALYISATSSGGFTSRAVVQNAWGANDAYRQGEDATVFLMDEWTTPFGIYTISSDHQPLSINLFSDMELIPLACYAQQPTDTLQVSFEGEAGYVGEWHLYDAEEGTRTKLVAGMSLHLSIPTDGKVRYYLEKPADI
ncbi:MAG: hypothetical protein ACI3Z5_04615, partial [Paludibacteraceae bacterium]